MRLLTLAILLCAVAASARFGVVRTLDGRAFTGQVRLTPEGVVIVDVARSLISDVALTNVALISFPTNAPGLIAEPADESLPGPWRETDIGAARIAGSTRHERGDFTVRGAGRSIDGEADSFHYVFKPVRTDSEIIAEVVSIQYTHPFAKAGLMMRENLNEYSRHVTVALTARRGGALQFRARERAGAETAAPLAVFAPSWLKLQRRGPEFTASISRDGRAWSVIGKVTVPMGENIYAGLAVASAQEDKLNWTTFHKVREAPRLVNEDFAPAVELVSGSVIRGRASRADENEMTFAGGPRVVPVPMSSVARIVYQPLASEMIWKTRVSRPGVWVSNGDFFDGDFRSLEKQKLTISSVLYGLKTFDLDDEVLALVLQPRKLRPASFELQTADGATLLAAGVALGDGELRVRESALGELRVAAFEIVELRRR